MVCTFPETKTEFWCARDLQELLGYAEWRSFSKVISKAITSCENAGYEPTDHFGGITKMVDLGSGAKREITDIALSRYACHLIAQNGDPSKDQIAFAQTYFAVQTRKQEVIEKLLTEAKRVSKTAGLMAQRFLNRRFSVAALTASLVPQTNQPMIQNRHTTGSLARVCSGPF